MNEPLGLKIFVLGIVLLLLVFSLIFRKFISYPFCPLERYALGSYGGMKRDSNIFIFGHLIPTAFVTITIFILLTNITIIDQYFDKYSIIRIGSFIFIFLIFFFFNGLIIESYLEKTDNEYSTWKKSKFKKL